MNIQTKWTDEALIIEAGKYKSRKELQTANDSAYVTILKRKGLRDIAFAHMQLRPYIGKWSKEAIQQEALKYTSKTEFRKKAKGAYARASATSTLNKFCAHMIVKRVSWDKKSISKEALKYSTKEAFRTKAYPAYLKATRLNIIDEVTTHMIPPSKGTTKVLPDIPKHLAGVYILFNADTIVYIGKSKACMNSRIRNHLKTIVFTDITTYEISNEADMNIAEMYLIALHQPNHNTDGITKDKLTLVIPNLNSIITNTMQINLKEQHAKSRISISN